MATIITVSGADGSKQADTCNYQTPDGSLIRMQANRKVRWKCPDGDLQVDFAGSSPFKSGRKHLARVRKNQLTAPEETRDVGVRTGFQYTATVFLPNGGVQVDPTLDVDPDPGPKIRKRKKVPKKDAPK